MAWDMFLKIDGIDGDSTDDKHGKWIEVESFSHELAQPSGGSLSAQGTLAGARADHQDFSITKRMDSASPNLALYCCNAKPIPSISLELCRAMGDKTTFMVYTFKDAIISSVMQMGSGEGDDPVPMETICVRYSQIQWAYTQTDPSSGGKTGATIQQGWSTMANKQV